MNSLTVKALTAFIVTTGLVLMWTPVGMTMTMNPEGFECTNEQQNNVTTISGIWLSCVKDKYDAKWPNPMVHTPETCCHTFETYCFRQNAFTKVGCKWVSSDKNMQSIVDKCKQSLKIDVSAAYCATLPSAQKPFSDDKCKEYKPCDLIKSGPVDTQNNGGGSGGGSGGAGAGDTTTKKSSATSPKVNALLMTFIAITGIALLFVV